MKKVKFMLLAIAVIAIAGGTLAFKAKYDFTICTDEARTVPGSPNLYTCQITELGQTWAATCDDDVNTDAEMDDELVTLCYTFVDEESGTCVSITGENCETILADTIED